MVYHQSSTLFLISSYVVFSPMIPESPKWLLTHKKDREGAINVMKALRPDDHDIEEEVRYLYILYCIIYCGG